MGKFKAWVSGAAKTNPGSASPRGDCLGSLWITEAQVISTQIVLFGISKI